MNLVENLHPKLRQKVLMNDVDGSDDDEDQNDGEKGDTFLSRWGKKKAYWNADTADLEIGQEFEDAIDEEEAVKVRIISIIHV